MPAKWTFWKMISASCPLRAALSSFNWHAYDPADSCLVPNICGTCMAQDETMSEELYHVLHVRNVNSTLSAPYSMMVAIRAAVYVTRQHW